MEWAQQFVEQYGYWAVFIWTFIEGESVFIAAAALAAAGLLTPWKVIVVAACGAYAGHIVFFMIGRWKGIAVIEAVPFLKRHYPKADMILDQYAHWSIFIFQYLYGTRLVAAIMFGCSSIGFVRFALLQVVNCLSVGVDCLYGRSSDRHGRHSHSSSIRCCRSGCRAAGGIASRRLDVFSLRTPACA